MQRKRCNWCFKTIKFDDFFYFFFFMEVSALLMSFYLQYWIPYQVSYSLFDCILIWIRSYSSLHFYSDFSWYKFHLHKEGARRISGKCPLKQKRNGSNFFQVSSFLLWVSTNVLMIQKRGNKRVCQIYFSCTIMIFFFFKPCPNSISKTLQTTLQPTSEMAAYVVWWIHSWQNCR